MTVTAPAAQTSPIKTRRGDLVMVEMRPTYTVVAKDVAKADKVTEYELMIVTNLFRDGRIKMVRSAAYAGGAPRQFEGMLHATGSYWVLPQADWNVDAAIELAKSHTYPQSTTPEASRLWKRLAKR